MSKYQYLDKEIKAIEEGDRVRILGTIVEKGNDYFALEDNTGKIKVKLSSKELEKYQKGQLVRVFGEIKDNKFDPTLIQSMEGFNLNLYQKVKEILNKFKNLKNENV